MSTPSPTPWATTPYEQTGAVDQFHGCLRMGVSGVFSGTNDFPVDDPTNQEYYMGVVATAFIPLAVVIIFMIPFYWSYLCCRNGCCHEKFYKHCPSLCNVCCFCFAPCCMGEKGRGCRSGQPRGKPYLARMVLFLCFALIVGLNLGINQVRQEVNDGAVKVTDLLDDVSDMLTDLYDYALEMNTTAGDISSYANTLDCSEDYSDQTESISDASSVIAVYAVLISEQIGGLPNTISNLSDNITDNGESYVNQAGLALAVLGILYAVLGIFGTLCVEFRHPLRCASGWLAFTNAFGVLMLIIIALLLAGELTAGIVLGDFCAADIGPSNALVSIMESQADDSASEAIDLMTFYATCEGTNPMSAFLDSQQVAVTNMTDTLDSYKDLFIHETMCCNSSYSTDDIDVDTVGDYCTFYSETNPNACTTDSLCDYNGGTDNGACAAAGGCSNTSYTGIVNDINYLAIDNDGPLVGFIAEFSCTEINPKLAKLINEIMCDSLIESLWWMVAVHISVLVIMYLVMIMSSFARQVIYEQTLEKDAEAEDIKDNYANVGPATNQQPMSGQEEGQYPALPMPGANGY